MTWQSTNALSCRSTWTPPFLLNCTSLPILACTKALVIITRFILQINLSTHFATSRRRRRGDTKIKGLNNTSSPDLEQFLLKALPPRFQHLNGDDETHELHLGSFPSEWLIWIFFWRGRVVLSWRGKKPSWLGPNKCGGPQKLGEVVPWQIWKVGEHEIDGHR